MSDNTIAEVKRRQVSEYAYKSAKIRIGMFMDDITNQIPNSMLDHSSIVGRDEDGLIVEWHYKFGLIITLARATGLNEATGLPLTSYFSQKLEVIDA